MSNRLLLSLSLLAACRGYEPAPLDPHEVFATVEARRHAPDEDPDPALTHARLQRWLHTHSPELQSAVAAYATELAVAGIATPWPNPVLDLGVDFASGPAAVVNETAPQLGFVLSLPLSGRLAATDAWNLARAEAARLRALGLLRRLELDLRARTALLGFARRELSLAQELAENAEQTRRLAARLVDAGELGAIDLGTFELAATRAQSDVLAAEVGVATATSALAALLGVATERLDAPLPPPPALHPALAELGTLRARMITEHAGLAHLRGEYEIAEQRLRLEVAQQYPDLTLGATYGDDAGDDKTVLGLRVGLELPLFDRNQQGIAEAEHRRVQARLDYEGAATTALAELERAHRVAAIAMRQQQWLADTALPQAERNTERARQALTTGAYGALRLADAQRTERELRRELLMAQRAALQAWIDLERAVGVPLGEDAPAQPPPALRAPAAENLREQERG